MCESKKKKKRIYCLLHAQTGQTQKQVLSISATGWGRSVLEVLKILWDPLTCPRLIQERELLKVLQIKRGELLLRGYTRKYDLDGLPHPAH